MSAFECVRQVYQTDGFRGFYRGMSASYAGISETVIHFVIYENIKRRLLEAKAPQNMDEEEDLTKDASDFVGMMLAAATSKTCATSIAYPHGERLLLAVLIWMSDHPPLCSLTHPLSCSNLQKWFARDYAKKATSTALSSRR